MLIKCPECDLMVSDKAILCPHCGYPFKPDKISRKSTKKKRLPNGFGQISFIKGNLRKPYRAMISIGKTKFGRPISKLLQPEAYFRSYNEAYEALIKYHQDPRTFCETITMEELFDTWIEIHRKDLGNDRTYYNYLSLWAYAWPLYKLRVRDVRLSDIEDCVLNATKISPDKTIEASISTKKILASILNQMMEYAVNHDMTDKNYARMFKFPKSEVRDLNPKDAHKAFTKEELNIIENNINTGVARMILVQCYSGWRPSELLNIKLSDVDLFLETFTGGMKTAAGKDRTVPIHSKISPMVKAQYSLAKHRNSEYLFFNSKYKKLQYGVYATKFADTLKELGIDPSHKPHDPRVTFVTMAKDAELNEYAIKYLVGHSIQDITEKVYTKRDLDWLKSEIEKIR